MTNPVNGFAHKAGHPPRRHDQVRARRNTSACSPGVIGNRRNLVIKTPHLRQDDRGRGRGVRTGGSAGRRVMILVKAGGGAGHQLGRPSAADLAAVRRPRAGRPRPRGAASCATSSPPGSASRSGRSSRPSGVSSVYTDEEAMDVFLMAYAGVANKTDRRPPPAARRQRRRAVRRRRPALAGDGQEGPHGPRERQDQAPPRQPDRPGREGQRRPRPAPRR